MSLFLRYQYWGENKQLKYITILPKGFISLPHASINQLYPTAIGCEGYKTHRFLLFQMSQWLHVSIGMISWWVHISLGTDRTGSCTENWYQSHNVDVDLVVDIAAICKKFVVPLGRNKLSLWYNVITQQHKHKVVWHKETQHQRICISISWYHSHIYLLHHTCIFTLRCIIIETDIWTRAS